MSEVEHDSSLNKRSSLGHKPMRELIPDSSDISSSLTKDIRRTDPWSSKNMPLFNFEKLPEFLDIFHQVPSGIFLETRTPTVTKRDEYRDPTRLQFTHGLDFPAPLWSNKTIWITWEGLVMLSTYCSKTIRGYLVLLRVKKTTICRISTTSWTSCCWGAFGVSIHGKDNLVPCRKTTVPRSLNLLG